MDPSNQTSDCNTKGEKPECCGKNAIAPLVGGRVKTPVKLSHRDRLRVDDCALHLLISTLNWYSRFKAKIHIVHEFNGPLLETHGVPGSSSRSSWSRSPRAACTPLSLRSLGRPRSSPRACRSMKIDKHCKNCKC